DQVRNSIEVEVIDRHVVQESPRNAEMSCRDEGPVSPAPIDRGGGWRSLQRHEIQETVPIDIEGMDREWIATYRNANQRPEDAAPLAEEDGDVARIEICHQQIRMVIPIDIADCGAGWTVDTLETEFVVERSVPGSQEHGHVSRPRKRTTRQRVGNHEIGNS